MPNGYDGHVGYDIIVSKNPNVVRSGLELQNTILNI